MSKQAANHADENSSRFTLGVLPSGTVGIIATLRVEPGGKSQLADESLPLQLVERFRHSTAEGMTQLASHEWKTGLSPIAEFWRDFSRRYFQSLCRGAAQQTRGWNSPEPPCDEQLSELLQAAPPMMGLEYLRTDSLRQLWQSIDALTKSNVSLAKSNTNNKPDVAEYLHSLDPVWNLVGRVTFHLAENKKNPALPFAFLATYTDGKAKSGSLNHIPLATALKQSIETGDSARLDQLLEPVSRAARECDLVQELLESRAMFSPQAWTIRKAFDFLSSVPKLEQGGVIVRVPNWWNASRPPRPQVSVRLGNKKTSALGGAEALDFSVDVALDGEPLSEEEIQALLSARDGLALLRGKWVQVDEGRLQSALTHWQTLEEQHAGGMGFLEGMRLLSGATFSGDPIDDEVRQWTRIQPGAWLADTMRSLRDPAGNIQLDTPSQLNATLRPYQTEGLRWLWFANQIGIGVCLADDMGLGKTIQVIALLLRLKFPANKPAKPNATPSPSLLVVPTSLLGNWMREVERFAPDLNILVAHRSITDPKTLKKIAADPVASLSAYDLVVTTYGLARRNKWLSEMDWRLVILDEAQAIKNSSAAQTKAIKKIPAGHRIVLTGTPVENHLGDLWSLFDFCSPGLLGTASEFKKFVNATEDPKRNVSLASLRRLIQPYVLRRLKTDPEIASELPDKTEMRVDCGLTATQAALYQQTLDDLEKSIDMAVGIQRSGLVLGALMQLKQICNHPALFLKSAEFDSDASGKYAELRRIAQTLIEKQEKMLVFTQFQSMCGPLQDFLSELFGRPGLTLSGKTASAKRGKLVAEFQKETGPPFFVISVKAGGTGLNLTEACHVVHFDRWWNPAVEDQATDRAFRIGQKRNVLVHKFVCRGTLEERIDELIYSKRQLSAEIFGEQGDLNLTEMSNEELMRFVSLDLNKATAT
ncbi:DEAD/DEAH box helicase [Novipirellula sp. SH528]|uniref:DEAD/DEAH box helicase n=1 Tax=Novipirellula sp. SH528 TaxID=3454466 RepID=UPI003FA02E05